jgi:perosamine synthetase
LKLELEMPQQMRRSPIANRFPGVLGTFMGRDALALAVASLNLKPDDAVLLPAYLCREVVKPFLGRTRVLFYELGPELTAEPGIIDRKLSEERVKVLMIINYFGFLQPCRQEIKQICARHGTLLIEDCAHSLLTEGSGETGDMAIYSFRKTLPVPDGGGLKMNTPGITVLPHFYPRAYSNVLSVLILLKSRLAARSELLSRAGISSRAKAFTPDTASAHGARRILPLSSFASRGIKRTSFPDIIRQQRGDFMFWQELAKTTRRFTPVFSCLPPGVSPLGYPVRVDDRDSLKSRLQDGGIFLKVHWHLPEAIGDEFLSSHSLSKQMITLPVYPELGRKEREGIAGALGA